eukprot:3390898-Rhodomonas_salina.2
MMKLGQNTIHRYGTRTQSIADVRNNASTQILQNVNVHHSTASRMSVSVNPEQLGFALTAPQISEECCCRRACSASRTISTSGDGSGMRGGLYGVFFSTDAVYISLWLESCA